MATFTDAGFGAAPIWPTNPAPIVIKGRWACSVAKASFIAETDDKPLPQSIQLFDGTFGRTAEAEVVNRRVHGTAKKRRFFVCCATATPCCHFATAQDHKRGATRFYWAEHGGRVPTPQHPF